MESDHQLKYFSFPYNIHLQIGVQRKLFQLHIQSMGMNGIFHLHCQLIQQKLQIRRSRMQQPFFHAYTNQYSSFFRMKSPHRTAKPAGDIDCLITYHRIFPDKLPSQSSHLPVLPHDSCKQSEVQENQPLLKMHHSHKLHRFYRTSN